jgi:hypothetical protein
MRTEEVDSNNVVSQPRCEIDKTLLGGECERPGGVMFRGLLVLCRPHAELLKLEDREEALVGSVSRMDVWMEQNRSAGADEEFVGRIRHERDEAAAALRLTRTQLRSARRAL